MGEADASRHGSGARGAESDETCLKGSRQRRTSRTDCWVKRRPRVFGRPVEDASRRSRRTCASNRVRDGGARGRVSPERSLRSSRPWGAMLDPWKDPRRGVTLRPSGLALGGESEARSSAALRVWDGPSGFLWRESREKPDSDSDYGCCDTDSGAAGRFCLLRDRAELASAWQTMWIRCTEAGCLCEIRAASQGMQRLPSKFLWEIMGTFALSP